MRTKGNVIGSPLAKDRIGCNVCGICDVSRRVEDYFSDSWNCIEEGWNQFRNERDDGRIYGE